MIDLSLMPHPLHDMWRAAIDLAQREPRGWTLIGAQMVALHGLERGQIPPRASVDLDALVDV